MGAKNLLEVQLNPFTDHRSDLLFEPQKDHHLGVEIPLIMVGQVPIEHVQAIFFVRVLVSLISSLCVTPVPRMFLQQPHPFSSIREATKVFCTARAAKFHFPWSRTPWPHCYKCLHFMRITSSLSFALSLVTSAQHLDCVRGGPVFFIRAIPPSLTLF